ncbi:inositol monophosphatase family protein [Marinicella sp. W31]|uniref:inositol monophosphatase family protein n=1 Tax=Marinicella sp. W31 TaxID=3023713 RepID=UPI00375652F1
MTQNKPLEAVFLQNCLKTAHTAVDAAADVIQRYYGQLASVDMKADATPVTIADKESEAVIREVLSQQFPDHGFYGEELGRSSAENEDFVWLIDPIDGTKSFVRNYPFFSTQVALSYRGELVLGISNAPMMSEKAWATLGGGAFLNGEKIHINDDVTDEMSCVSTGNIRTLIETNWKPLGQLLKGFGKIRGYGDFYHYHLLASGKLDLVIESDVNILDIAALTVIVREAGGIVTQLDGLRIDEDSCTILAGSAKYHHKALQVLNNA